MDNGRKGGSGIEISEHVFADDEAAARSEERGGNVKDSVDVVCGCWGVTTTMGGHQQ